MWQDRIVDKTGDRVKFERFEDFVTTQPLEGIGATIDIVRNLVRDDEEALNLLDAALQKKDGGNNNPSGKNQHNGKVVTDNNVISDHATRTSPVGNSKAKALRTLSEKAPEILARVIKGELSPHAGMKQAGFRRDPSPLSLLKSAWFHPTRQVQEMPHAPSAVADPSNS